MKLELSYGINSTSPAVLLESPALVADGKNHRVRTKLSPDFMSIRVDEGIVFTQAVPKVGRMIVTRLIGLTLQVFNKSSQIF